MRQMHHKSGYKIIHVASHKTTHSYFGIALLLLHICLPSFAYADNKIDAAKNIIPKKITNTNTSKQFNSKQIERLIQKTLPNANVGIVLQDAETGKILYQRRSSEPFPPASNVKLFTAAAALWSLGPDYEFKTEIKIKKNTLKDKKLAGDLYVCFNGDPSLTRADLKQLIGALKSSGIEQIEGNVIIDTSRFQKPNYAAGWSHDSLAWYFAPPMTAVVLDENKVDILVISNSSMDKPAEVKLVSEDSAYIPLRVNLTTVTETKAATECQIHVNMDEKNHLNIGGCWPYQAEPTSLKVALKNPDYLAEQIILTSLQSEKISLSGKVLVETAALVPTDSTSQSIIQPNTGLQNPAHSNPTHQNVVQQAAEPQDFIVLATHRSKPLKELLKLVLQDSNNLYAESLTKTLGAEQFHQGSFQAGLKAIQTILKPTEVDFTDMKIYDGSGVSRYNLITPRQFARLLFALSRDKKNYQDFRNALATFGNSGTLKDREAIEHLGKIQAKTGGLIGVATLSGYLTPKKSQKDIIFVLMIDHIIQDNKVVKDFQNEFCRLVLTQIN
jgi:D-alanyl-D-alanine carboxypeptidase/D-alanyl-D-alanine-endopeptidase (penicillin-binding protein 4)